MEQQNQNFTEGKILSPLIRFALPILLALFLQSMYGAVDLLIVGQFSDAAGVSAVSTGSQAMMFLTMVVAGLSMGSTILLARRIGEGRPEACGQVVGTSVALFATIGLVVAVGMQFLSAPAARVLQAPAQAFDQTVAYIRICCGGALFIVAYNLLGGIFRGMGNSKLPLITVAIACVVNIAGDLLLVGGFGMGAAGAAIATVFAQAVSVVLSLIIIRKKGLPFAFSLRQVGFHTSTVREIVKLGSPIALQDALVGISFLVILAIVNQLGVIVSAGIGVAEKICGFVMLVPSAFNQAMSAFVGQNMGAEKPERAKKALWYGILTGLSLSVVIAYVTFFHGDLLSAIFSRDTAVIAASSEYLKAYAVDCLLVSFLFCFMGYFNGCGRTTFVMAQGILGAFCVRIPVSYWMSRAAQPSLFHIGLATPASSVVQILLCVGYFLLMERRRREREL